MKKKYLIGIISAVVVLALALTVVLVVLFKKDKVVNAPDLTEAEKTILGNWAYNHDKDTKVAIFRGDRTSEFEGEKSTFTCDGEYIYLTEGEKTEKYHYTLSNNDSEMDFYKKSTYVLEQAGVEDSIIGVWVCPETGLSFEFTAKGTFLEDNAFTGYYRVNEEIGKVYLNYELHLPDAEFYYRLDGDKLFVEYPWAMTKVK